MHQRANALGRQAHVHVQLFHFIILFSVFFRKQMRRQRADHAQHRPLFGMHRHARAGQDARIDAAHAREADGAVLFHVGGHQADFVFVGGHQHARSMIAHAGNHAAHRVDFHRVAQRAESLRDGRGHRAFVA